MDVVFVPPLAGVFSFVVLVWIVCLYAVQASPEFYIAFVSLIKKNNIKR